MALAPIISPHLIDSFLTALCSAMQVHGLDPLRFVCDHLCYRADSAEGYSAAKAEIGGTAHLLSEALVGGRLISTYFLATPIRFLWRNQEMRIPMLEIPAPKPGRPFAAGLEHAEFVVGKRPEFLIHEFPDLRFDERALAKADNPELQWMVPEESPPIAAKFHPTSLLDVIQHERWNEILLPIAMAPLAERRATALLAVAGEWLATDPEALVRWSNSAGVLPLLSSVPSESEYRAWATFAAERLAAECP